MQYFATNTKYFFVFLYYHSASLSNNGYNLMVDRYGNKNEQTVKHLTLTVVKIPLGVVMFQKTVKNQ